MNNRQKRWLKKEIRIAIENYLSDDNTDLESAMLSGMSLVASFLTRNDGSDSFRAADVYAAIMEYAAEAGLKAEKNRNKKNES